MAPSDRFLTLSPEWEAYLAQSPKKKEVSSFVVLPVAPQYYAQKLSHVTTAEEAQRLVELAYQRPLSHVGFDFEYQFSTPAIALSNKTIRHDVRSIRPLLFSVALAEPRKGNHDGTLYPFVVDLRVVELHPVLAELFRLPVSFAGHFLRGDLFCLLQLGLPVPRTIWDTQIHEMALHLGQHHQKYRQTGQEDVVQEIHIQEETRKERGRTFSLQATCERYEVPLDEPETKASLQESFLTHDPETPFTQAQIRYASEDAVAVARLYPAQTLRATNAGILHHLITVEMPWVQTSVGIEWAGVRIDQTRQQGVIKACQAHRTTLSKRLREHGLTSPRSHPQLTTFFKRAGLLHLFRKGKKITFEKDRLKDLQGAHPIIPCLLAARRVSDILSGKVIDERFVGVDGRIHPSYRQLGTDTSRETSRQPNIQGLDSALRPLIIPDPNYGIGEVDLSQIEIGIAAAIYQDPELIRMFNTGDVYSAMAQLFFQDRLPVSARDLSTTEFKLRYPEERATMKNCTLGIIYGVTAHGLSAMLHVTEPKAKQLMVRFGEMFPVIHNNLERSALLSGIRGYADTITGLHRRRPATQRRLSHWERNWLGNFPIQGSAAVLFKMAGNRLHRLYPQYDARLIIPLHDAFVFEAPLARLQEVADLTRQVMCDSVREFFPELQPGAEINIDYPDCWNKERDVDVLERWIQDPLAKAGPQPDEVNEGPTREKDK